MFRALNLLFAAILASVLLWFVYIIFAPVVRLNLAGNHALAVERSMVRDSSEYFFVRIRGRGDLCIDPAPTCGGDAAACVRSMGKLRMTPGLYAFAIHPGARFFSVYQAAEDWTVDDRVFALLGTVPNKGDFPIVGARQIKVSGQVCD